MDELRPKRARREGGQAARLRERRRRRLLPLFAGIGIVAVAVLALEAGGSGGGGGAPGPAATSTATRAVLIARKARPLPAPVSGESAVGLRTGPLILGGLDAAEGSVSGVFQLDASSGRLHEAGALAVPLHDAAATRLGDRVLVFGGGAEASSDMVQALPLSGGALAEGAAASAIGHLPTARSDLNAVSFGGRAYVLGGYDDANPIDSVLATTDGLTFKQVATLPAPARYLAVAALGGRIYAFGGETASGGTSDTIQAVDPAADTARVVGHLPHPLSHAAAIALGGAAVRARRGNRGRRAQRPHLAP